MHVLTPVMAAMIAAVAVNVPTAVADDSSAEEKKVMVTDFRGRPPYARKFVTVDETASLARLEEVTEKAEADTDVETRATDFSGRPPFNRNARVTDDAVEAEFSRLEEVDDSKPTRRGPPGKPGSRR